MFLLVQGCALPGLDLGQGLGGTTGGAPATGALTGPLIGSLPAAPASTGSLGAAPTGGTAAPASTGGPSPYAGGSTSDLDAWPGGKLSPDQFFKMIAPAVIASSKKTGVPPAVTMAQAALETGWGKSSIGDAKNLFGIKGTGPAGSISAQTGEEINGSEVSIQDSFRKYNSWEESIEDHDNLLSQNSRYASAMAVSNDPEEFARQIQQDGYATESDYADQLIKIMRQYNLESITSASA